MIARIDVPRENTYVQKNGFVHSMMIAIARCPPTSLVTRSQQ